MAKTPFGRSLRRVGLALRSLGLIVDLTVKDKTAHHSHMFRPTQDYILVRPLPRELSETLTIVTNEKHARGKVLAIGPGKLNKHGRRIQLDTQIGDIVHFGNGENFDWFPKIYEGNECLRLIQEADVAYIEEPEVKDAERMRKFWESPVSEILTLRPSDGAR